MLRSFSWVVLLLPSIALAALNGRGASVIIRAERTADSIRVDGRMDEAAWRRAPPFRDFAQSFPEFDVREQLQVESVVEKRISSIVSFASDPDQVRLARHRFKRAAQICLERIGFGIRLNSPVRANR